MRAERVTDSLCYHGEGPVWWPTGAIRWVDMLAGDVMTMTADGEVTRTHVGTVVACLRPREGGGAILALEHALATTERDDLTALVEHAPVVTDPGVRFNEGGVDPQGRFWAGSMAYDQHEGGASLYRFAADLAPEVVLPRVTISNGIDWSPDGATGCYVDTATHEVTRFDQDPEAGMTNPRTFVRCPDESPDGLVVDADGGVWVAINGAGVVRGYDADGRQHTEIEVGARQVTACTFGGDDLGTLYVTTSREGLGEDDDPTAGSLYAVRPGATGRPARAWRA